MSAYNIELRPFDVLLYRGGLRPWTPDPYIRLVTWSDKVHAGLVVQARLGGTANVRNLVLDAKAGGIDVRPVSADVLNGESIRVLRVPLDHPWPLGASDALAEFAWSNWSVTGYAFGKLLAQVYHEIVGAGPRDPAAPPSRYICSELVSRLLRMLLGFDPCPQFRDATTTPADLDRTSRLREATRRLQLVEARQ